VEEGEGPRVAPRLGRPAACGGSLGTFFKAHCLVRTRAAIGVPHWLLPTLYEERVRTPQSVIFIDTAIPANHLAEGSEILRCCSTHPGSFGILFACFFRRRRRRPATRLLEWLDRS